MKLTINIVLIILWGLSLQAQNNYQSDSTEVAKIVSEFLEWYIDAINTQDNVEFSPKFIEDDNGMTTLDYSKYINNLRKVNFSEELIESEKNYYQECIDNLAKVKYSDFKTEFDDLDDFEATNCDFNNHYRWTGGQEAVDGIRINNIQFENKQKSIVLLEYYEYNSYNKKNFYWGKNKVTLIKLDDSWKILDINWK